MFLRLADSGNCGWLAARAAVTLFLVISSTAIGKAQEDRQDQQEDGGIFQIESTRQVEEELGGVLFKIDFEKLENLVQRKGTEAFELRLGNQREQREGELGRRAMSFSLKKSDAKRLTQNSVQEVNQDSILELVGSLAEDDDSKVDIKIFPANKIRKEKSLFVRIVNKDGVFVIRPYRQNLHILEESRRPPNYREERPKLSDLRLKLVRDENQEFVPEFPKPDPKSPIELKVAVFYTQLARIDSGDSITNTIQLSFDWLNEAFQKSGIHAKATVVHLEEVGYLENKFHIFENLEHVIGKQDGYLDHVHSTRLACGADLVCLFVRRKDYRPGVAVRLEKGLNCLEFAPFAFTVVDYKAADSYYTLTHEVGHLLGGCHENESENPIFQFSSPHTFRVRSAGQDWLERHTIMSTQDVKSRENLFSNPLLRAPGQSPTGRTGVDRKADHALTINETIPVVSQFHEYLQSLESD